jgi:uncharacterized membrane protein
MSTGSHDVKPMLSISERILDKLRHRGTYVDYWTCIHVATGILLGFLLARANVRLSSGLGIATAVLVLWEFAEPPLHRVIGRQFPEKITNQIADVLAGLIGYVVGLTFVDPFAPLEILLGILDFLAR